MRLYLTNERPCVLPAVAPAPAVPGSLAAATSAHAAGVGIGSGVHAVTGGLMTGLRGRQISALWTRIQATNGFMTTDKQTAKILASGVPPREWPV